MLNKENLGFFSKDQTQGISFEDKVSTGSWTQDYVYYAMAENLSTNFREGL